MIHSILPYGGRDLYGVKSIKEETEYPLMSVDGYSYFKVLTSKVEVHTKCQVPTSIAILN